MKFFTILAQRYGLSKSNFGGVEGEDLISHINYLLAALRGAHISMNFQPLFFRDPQFIENAIKQVQCLTVRLHRSTKDC